MLSNMVAPVVGIVVSTSAGIAFDGIAKQLVPTDLKALPAFGIKIGVAVVGGLLAGKLADIVVKNVESVVNTARTHPESEEASPDIVQDEN